MAKADFSFYEGVFTDWAKGKILYPYPDLEPSRQEVISYIKAKKETQMIYAHCESGAVIPMGAYEEFTWEVNNENTFLLPNSKKAKKRNNES